MNIYFKELKSNLKSLLFWILGLAFLIVAGMAKFSGLTSTGDNINQMMQIMPKSVLAIFGMGGIDINTVTGYYGVLFIYALFMAAIYAFILGSTILSKEERDKTSEFLFVKPITRIKAIVAKLFASLTYLTIFIATNYAFSVVGINQFEPIKNHLSVLNNLTISMALVSLIFLSLGFMLSGILKNSKMASSIGLYVLLLGYIIYVLISLNDKLKFLTFLTPFYYFPIADIVAGKSLSILYIIVSIILSISFIVTSMITYSKRDLMI